MSVISPSGAKLTFDMASNEEADKLSYAGTRMALHMQLLTLSPCCFLPGVAFAQFTLLIKQQS